MRFGDPRIAWHSPSGKGIYAALPGFFFAVLKPVNGVISLTVRKSSTTSNNPYINAVRLTAEP